MGISLPLPTPFDDEFSVLGLYSSGNWGYNMVTAFLPITPAQLGYVLKPDMSGISMISLDYISRISKTLSARVSSFYFFRSDTVTYEWGNSGYLLGNEFFVRLFLNPVSDLQLDFGAGIFLPSLGNVAPNASPFWRCELNLVFSLY